MKTDRKTKTYGSFSYDDEEAVPLMLGEGRHTHPSLSDKQHTPNTTWSRLISGDLTAIFMPKLQPPKAINAREYGKVKETLPVVAISGELVGEGKLLPEMTDGTKQRLIKGDAVAILTDKGKAPDSVHARANKKKH